MTAPPESSDAFVGSGQRRCLAAYAAREVARLQPQRLLAGDPGRVGVALTQLDVLAVGGRLPGTRAVAGAGVLDALVEDLDLLVGVHVVKDGHALGSNDGDLAGLVGVQPGEVQVRDDPVGEAQRAEDDVLDTLVDEALPLGGDALGLLTDEVQEHGDVVRAQ